MKEDSSSGIFWMSWAKLSVHKDRGGIGFRNFHDFNLALLGKQLWRLITCPNRLSSIIYKARYFPDSHVFDAKLGDNPSYIWRSLWESKSIVVAGARWNLGRGDQVKVSGHPWLINEDNPFITSELQGLEQATVASLMSMDGQGWDADIIADLFNARDQRCILNIQLGGEIVSDRLFWHEDSTGDYTSEKCLQIDST